MIHRRLCSLTLLLLSLVSCTGVGTKIEIGYMRVQPSGSLALQTSGPGGGLSLDRNNDINDDLGIATEVDSPYARVELDFGLLHLTGSGFRVQDKAMGQLSAEFGNIPINTPVETDLDLQIYKLAATLDLIDIGPVRISPGLAADVVISSTTVTATSLSVQEDLDGTLPLPMLFVQSAVDLGVVDFVLDLGWLDVSYGDISGEIVDFEAMLRVKPIGPLTLFVGYRAVLLDIEGDQDGDRGRIDLEFKGWMGGLGLHF